MVRYLQCDVVIQAAAAGSDDDVSTRRSSVWHRLSKVTRRAPTTTAADKSAQSSTSRSRAPGNGSVPRQAPVRITMNHCSPSSPPTTTVAHGRMRLAVDETVLLLTYFPVNFFSQLLQVSAVFCTPCFGSPAHDTALYNSNIIEDPSPLPLNFFIVNTHLSSLLPCFTPD